MDAEFWKRWDEMCARHDRQWKFLAWFAYCGFLGIIIMMIVIWNHR